MKKIICSLLCLLMLCGGYQQSVAAIPNQETTNVDIERVAFWVISVFGMDGSYRKILVEDKAGHRYYIWYNDSIGTKEGERVTISIYNRGYSSESWNKIEAANGNTSSIYNWSKK